MEKPTEIHHNSHKQPKHPNYDGFFQGKTSEFAWILEIPYTMHPAGK